MKNKVVSGITIAVACVVIFSFGFLVGISFFDKKPSAEIVATLISGSLAALAAIGVYIASTRSEEMKRRAKFAASRAAIPASLSVILKELEEPEESLTFLIKNGYYRDEYGSANFRGFRSYRVDENATVAMRKCIGYSNSEDEYVGTHLSRMLADLQVFESIYLSLKDRVRVRESDKNPYSYYGSGEVESTLCDLMLLKANLEDTFHFARKGISPRINFGETNPCSVFFAKGGCITDLVHRGLMSKSYFDINGKRREWIIDWDKI